MKEYISAGHTPEECATELERLGGQDAIVCVFFLILPSLFLLTCSSFYTSDQLLVGQSFSYLSYLSCVWCNAACNDGRFNSMLIQPVSAVDAAAASAACCLLCVCVCVCVCVRERERESERETEKERRETERERNVLILLICPTTEFCALFLGLVLRRWSHAHGTKRCVTRISVNSFLFASNVTTQKKMFHRIRY